MFLTLCGLLFFHSFVRMPNTRTKYKEPYCFLPYWKVGNRYQLATEMLLRWIQIRPTGLLPAGRLAATQRSAPVSVSDKYLAAHKSLGDQTFFMIYGDYARSFYILLRT